MQCMRHTSLNDECLNQQIKLYVDSIDDILFPQILHVGLDIVLCESADHCTIRKSITYELLQVVGTVDVIPWDVTLSANITEKEIKCPKHTCVVILAFDPSI